MLSFSFIGIAWSSISNIPYRIVSGLEEEGTNIMIYFAVFNFSVVIPQIVAAYILGVVNKTFFHNETIYIMLLGSLSMLLAGLLMLIFYPASKRL